MIQRVEVHEDYAHLFLEALPEYSPAEVARVVRSLSAGEILQRFAWLKSSYEAENCGAMGISSDRWGTKLWWTWPDGTSGTNKIKLTSTSCGTSYPSPSDFLIIGWSLH